MVWHCSLCLYRFSLETQSKRSSRLSQPWYLFIFLCLFFCFCCWWWLFVLFAFRMFFGVRDVIQETKNHDIPYCFSARCVACISKNMYKCYLHRKSVCLHTPVYLPHFLCQSARPSNRIWTQLNMKCAQLSNSLQCTPKN